MQRIYFTYPFGKGTIGHIWKTGKPFHTQTHKTWKVTGLDLKRTNQIFASSVSWEPLSLPIGSRDNV